MQTQGSSLTQFHSPTHPLIRPAAQRALYVEDPLEKLEVQSAQAMPPSGAIPDEVTALFTVAEDVVIGGIPPVFMVVF